MNFGIDKVIKFLLFYILLNNLCGVCLSNSTCTTPDGGIGICILTPDCTNIADVLKTIKRPLTESAERQLQAYICNMDIFKVCCPSSPVIIKEDLPNHKNFHLLPTECGFVDIAGIRVINGQDADLTEFPWMALLSFRESDNSRDFKCGGTIINERYILTAAHCLEEKSRLISVRVGEYDKSSDRDCYQNFCNDPVQDVAIEERIPHPDYRTSTYENDIGLLRVTPIKFNQKNIRPICLPVVDDSVPIDDKHVEITGWGLTRQFARTSNVMQKAYLPIVSLTECQNLYKTYDQVVIDHRLMCAGGGVNKSFACIGDSGGPIQVQEKFNKNFLRYVQYGVVSLGPKTCDFPSTFTKVKYFMDWILDNMKP